MFLLLDSGAYSAWTSRKEVDLDEYCIFIRDNIDHIDAYAALDVIPGVKGRTPTPEEVEESASKGWDNLLYMRDVWGLDPIPVLHQGESFKWLDRMLEAGCGYIGLSPRIMNPTPIKQQWLDSVWKRLVDADGRAIVKTHGFGMNALPLLFRYPWYTVDASTWVKRAMYGKVLMPHTNKHTGAWDFSKVPRDVRVSDKAPKDAPDLIHRHGAAEQARIIKWIEEAGQTFEQCRGDNWYARAHVNAYFFKCVSMASNGGTDTFNPHAQTIFEVE